MAVLILAEVLETHTWTRQVAMAVGFDGMFYCAFLSLKKAVELKPCSAIRHFVI